MGIFLLCFCGIFRPLTAPLSSAEAPVKKRAGGVIDDEELFSVRADDDDSDLQAALSRSRRYSDTIL